VKNIVLLHGAIGASDQLEKLESELKKDFNVFKLDFIGHGKRSNEESEFSIDIFAKDLDQFLKLNRILNPIIFGYSMGGYVAIYHALHFENRAEKIITLGTKFSWSPEIAAKETKMLNADIISEKVPQFAQQLKIRHTEYQWKNVLNKTANMMIGMGLNNPTSSNELENLEVPVRFGLGDKDQMVSLEETVLFYKSSKSGSMFVLPDTQHPIENVRTEDLCFQIKQFVN
jgi:pimeloyl-ACP methyl ester carboxylesterase